MEETGIFWAQEALWASTLDFFPELCTALVLEAKFAHEFMFEIGEMQKKTYFCFECQERT